MVEISAAVEADPLDPQLLRPRREALADVLAFREEMRALAQHVVAEPEVELDLECEAMEAGDD